MPASSGDRVSPELVNALLALPTRKQQTDFLRASGLLGSDGLDRLLDVAERLTRENPGKAQRLAELCVEVAEDADAPATLPRAAYIRVHTHNENGEFDAALRLIEVARDGYVALGMNLEALRTNVGRMVTLLESGRYEEALDAGQVVLNALDGASSLKVSPTQQEADLLTALVHQNRGGCLEYMGQYEEALAAYALAQERYEALGMLDRIGEILDNRGAIFSALGRGTEALAAHEAAAAIFDGAGLTLSHAKTLGNIGETQLQIAEYARSLDTFEQARVLLRPLDALAEECFLLRNIADSYLALNLYSEALATYGEADGLLRRVGMEHDRAQALWGMGSALMSRSELDKAEEALAEAARLFAAADNLPMLSGVMLEQASLLEAGGKRETALATARRALEIASEDTWPVQQVYAHLRLADLLLPDVNAAKPHLMAARRLADNLALPQLRYRLNERLGRMRRLQGRHREARALLEEAVDEIERQRGTVAQDAMRASFLRDKTAAYEDLLLLHLAGDSEESIRRAFAVAERAKSRALIDLITGVAEKEPMISVDFELGQRIRTLQADLNAIYSELLDGPDGERPVPLQNLHARATEQEQEISRLRLQAAATGYSPDPFASSVSRDDIQEQLPPDTTLLAYHIAGDEVMAFVNVCGRTRIARDLSKVDKVNKLLQKLDVQWERFRAGREFAKRHTTMLERSARQVLSALHDELVAPLEPLLREAVDHVYDGNGSVPKLAVVSNGLLHQVPFHALFDGERYLIERFEFSYAPSATVYALCQERESRDRDGAAVFGVEDPSIPAAAAEARAVAERLPGTEVHVGESATVEALRSAVSRSGILHMACHGLFRSDNPMFSALKLHDGWLLAADAMTLDLPGALVILSACESGRNEVIGGDEVLGLTRAFLGAGAATLVVSLWLVQDETTAELMGGWYERLRDGEGRAAALRTAQLDIKERHPHPYYWAPFVLIGKR